MVWHLQRGQKSNFPTAGSVGGYATNGLRGVQPPLDSAIEIEGKCAGDCERRRLPKHGELHELSAAETNDTKLDRVQDPRRLNLAAQVSVH